MIREKEGARQKGKAQRKRLIEGRGICAKDMGTHEKDGNGRKVGDLTEAVGRWDSKQKVGKASSIEK